MPDDLAREVVRDWERHDGDRGTWKSHCQMVARYLDPDRADFTAAHTAGQRRMQWVFSAAPLFAHETAAAGFHAMWTSDTDRWFSTMPDDPRLAADPDVRRWFDAADQADYAVFNNPELNFPSHSHQTYLDMLGYGPGCMALLDGRNGALFSNRHLAEVCFAENEEDRVDQVMRRWQWTAKQGFDQWGAKAGEKVLKAYADGKDNEKFWFHHRVKPRASAGRDPTQADARNKPFESVYVSESDYAVIEIGGFDDFPYLCPRLSKRAPQDVMGRGRGMLMLPDIQMLNALARVVIRGAEGIIQPAMQAPHDGFIVPIRTSPGALIFRSPMARPTDRIEPIITHADIPVGIDLLNRVENGIRQGFFINLILTPTDPADPASAGKGVTATFTTQQTRENMRILSAINSRGNGEWKAPLLTRMRAMNWRKSVLRRFGPGSPYPMPPAALSGLRWRAQFRDQITLAQKAAEISAIDQLTQRQLMYRQIDPESDIVMDFPAALRREADDLGAPPGILKSPRMLEAEQRLKAQRAQQQHEAEVAQGGSAAVANLAQARQTMQAAA